MKYSFNICLFALVGWFFVLSPVFVHAQSAARPSGYATGWLNYFTDYLGADGTCQLHEGRWDYVVKEANSQNVVSNPEGLELEVWVYDRRTGTIVETKTSYNQVTSPSVCYDPVNQSTWANVNGRDSLYYSLNPVGYSHTGVSGLRNRYMRGTVHLQRKTAAPTAEAITANDTIYSVSNPSFSFLTNSPTTLYGANSNHVYWMWTWFSNGIAGREGRSNSSGYGDGGDGSGVRTRSLGDFSDNRYVWRFATRRNADRVVTQPDYNFDASCGTGRERLDIALKEVDTNDLVDMTGITGTVRVLNNSTGNVAQTVSWSPDSAISPTVCITPNSQTVQMDVRAGNSASYLNPGNTTITSEQEVTQNASGENYYRVSLKLPRRTVFSGSGGNSVAEFTIDFTRDNYYFTFNNMPEMSLANQAKFVIDTTSPTSAITAAGSIVGSNAVISLDNTVRDINSGLVSTRLVLDAVTAGAAEGALYQPFDQAETGVPFGEVGTRQVEVSFNVTPGATYQYYAVTRDAAGNVLTTSPQTITAPVLPPNLNASNFTVANTCESSEVNPTSGLCPTIPVSLRIGNTGAAVPNGRSIPYVVEYQLFGESTWQQVQAGTWTSGIPAGGSTPVITVNINNMPYGNHLVRARVNQPVNSALAETSFGDNTSPSRSIAVAPTPADIEISSSQRIIRYNEPAAVYWIITAPYELTCTVTGPGVARTFTHNPGTTDTSNSPAMSTALTNEQTFTISCAATPIDGFPISDVTQTLRVEVVPQAQEI